ncbi:dipeptidase PepV [Bacillus salitolerans]|uniref:Dipeptidase PepV n=1 Tax=Bacillus salitolerans TaxID=1437434 RepID=A0ABW4LX42_9BACI
MVNWNEEVLKRKEELMKDLFDLIRIESIKDEATKSERHPMGEKIGEALDFMLRLSEKSGLQTKNVDGYAGHAEYINDPSEETIGILCHVDVVPATGEWATPPFEPTIKDGKLYARGSIDDKGPTMAAFYGLKIVKELGLPLRKNIRIIFGTDEESGMSCMKYYREVENMPQIGFAPDADFPMINAEKGQMTLQISLPNATSETVEYLDLISFQSGARVNMVPERAVASITGNGVNELLDEFETFCEKLGVKRSVKVEENQAELNVFGVAAHGMEPHVGMNAGTLLASFLARFEFNRETNSYLRLLADLHEDFEAKSLNIQYKDDITGPLTINPGVIKYEKGQESYVQVNVRCPVTTNYEETKRTLYQEVERRGFQVTAYRESQPHHVDAGHPMIKVLQTVYQEESGLEPTLLSSGGATYARFMENGVAFGSCFPGKEMTAHQKDEYIEIEDLLKATAIYARAIYELAK